MHSNKNKVLTILVVLLVIIGAGIWYFVFYSLKNDGSQQVSDSTTVLSDGQNAKEFENENKFATLKGDAFDEAYIADMLAHHDGAVNMAEQAQAVTAHEEIRTLSGEILTTQGQEIMKMREWQKDWGYKETMSGGHMSHGGGGMDMGGDMVEMMNQLKGLTGEAYDKEFLKQMILHHEQAIEMSKYAENNAKHQEIKDLAKGVMATQTKEITQMKQWQKDWGYSE